MVRSYDSDNGSEFINTEFIAHLQKLDVEQTRKQAVPEEQSGYCRIPQQPRRQTPCVLLPV